MITSVLIAGHERSVPVIALALIFREIAGLQHLADVVEIGPHAHEQAAAPIASAAASAAMRR